VLYYIRLTAASSFSFLSRDPATPLPPANPADGAAAAGNETHTAGRKQYGGRAGDVCAAAAPHLLNRAT